MAKELQLSDFNCLITVKGRALTVNSIGDNTVEWVTRGKTWAHIEDVSKGESFRAARTEALVGQRVVIRKGSFPVRAGTEGVEGEPATSGHLRVSFTEEITNESATGLSNDDTAYAGTLIVDGTERALEVLGENAQTFEALITEIEAQAPVNGFVDDGVLRFLSPTAGEDSTVAYAPSEGGDSAPFPFDHFADFHGVSGPFSTTVPILDLAFTVAGVTESTATGLANDSTVYACTVVADAVEYLFEVVGEETQTIGQFISQLQTLVPGITYEFYDDGIFDENWEYISEEPVTHLVFYSPKFLDPEGTPPYSMYFVPVAGGGNDLLSSLANFDEYESVAGEDEVPEIPGVAASPGITADDVVIYDGRTMPIKAINNVREGRVEYVELICVQGDPTGPGVP